MFEPDRRSLITGLISLVAAPAIVLASSLMPVKALPLIRRPGFLFMMVSGADHVSAMTGASVTARIAKWENGKDVVRRCTNPVYEIGNGLYSIELTVQEVAGGGAFLNFEAENCDPTNTLLHHSFVGGNLSSTSVSSFS